MAEQLKISSLRKHIDTSINRSLLGVTLLLSLTTGCSKPDAVATAPPAIPVKVQTLSSATVEESSEFVGTLEAIQQVQVRPEIQGQIQAINVQEGDRVSQGASIMTLKPDASMPQYESAQASVNVAIAGRNTAQKQLQVAQAQLATAQSDLQLAQTNDERAQYLINEGAIGQYQADQASNQLDTARNRVKAAQDQVNAAREQIAQAEAGIQQAQAQVSAAQVNLDFKQITAPIAGIVGDLPVKLGDLATVGATVATITQNDFLDLRLSIPSNRSAQLRPGLPVQLIDPTSKNRLVTGSINFISPTVNSGQQSILVKARFPNGSGILRNGQYVQARVIWDKAPGLLVPTTAISRIGTESFVFVVEQATGENGEAQQIVRQRQVELGPIQGQSFQVQGGLKAGETIATTNILRLRDGAPIQSGTEAAAPATSPANPQPQS